MVSELNFFTASPWLRAHFDDYPHLRRARFARRVLMWATK